MVACKASFLLSKYSTWTNGSCYLLDLAREHVVVGFEVEILAFPGLDFLQKSLDEAVVLRQLRRILVLGGALDNNLGHGRLDHRVDGLKGGDNLNGLEEGSKG